MYDFRHPKPKAPQTASVGYNCYNEGIKSWTAQPVCKCNIEITKKEIIHLHVIYFRKQVAAKNIKCIKKLCRECIFGCIKKYKETWVIGQAVKAKCDVLWAGGSFVQKFLCQGWLLKGEGVMSFFHKFEIQLIFYIHMLYVPWCIEIDLVLNYPYLNLPTCDFK